MNSSQKSNINKSNSNEFTTSNTRYDYNKTKIQNINSLRKNNTSQFKHANNDDIYMNLYENLKQSQENPSNLKNFYAKVRYLNRKHNEKRSKNKDSKSRSSFYNILTNKLKKGDDSSDTDSSDDPTDPFLKQFSTSLLNDDDPDRLNYYLNDTQDESTSFNINSLKKYLNLTDVESSQAINTKSGELAKLSDVENERILKKLYKKFDLSMNKAPFNPIVDTKNEYYHQIVSKYQLHDTNAKKRYRESRLGIPQATSTAVPDNLGISGNRIINDVANNDPVEPHNTPQMPRIANNETKPTSQQNYNPRLEYFRNKVQTILEINGIGQLKKHKNQVKTQPSKGREEKHRYTFKMTFPSLTSTIARKLLNASYYPLSISKYQVDFRSETIRNVLERQEKSKKSKQTLASQSRIIFPSLLAKSQPELSKSMSNFDGLSSNKIERIESEVFMKKRELKRSKSELRTLTENRRILIKPKLQQSTQVKPIIKPPLQTPQSKLLNDPLNELLSKSMGDYKHVVTSTSKISNDKNINRIFLRSSLSNKDQKQTTPSNSFKNLPSKLPPIKLNLNQTSTQDVNYYKNFERINLNY